MTTTIDHGTAPRVTIEDIERFIISEHTFSAADGRAGAIAAGTYVGRERPQLYDQDLQVLGLLTICVLVLANGFTVIGKSACASATNFNAELGAHYAREDAIRQIWPLLGFQLRTDLAKQEGRL